LVQLISIDAAICDICNT